VNTTRTQQHMPDQRTSVPNLVLAGAHTRTFADVWTSRRPSRVDAGRRVVEPDVPVIPEHVPAPLRLARRVDDLCYGLGLRHLLDLLAVGLPALVVTALAARALHRARLDAELADLLGQALGRRLGLPPCSASSPVARD
jgi:hypothetical protein